MDPRNPGEAPLARLDRDRDAVRVQILATEHWGLLSARSNRYTEIFGRAGMLLTIVSATARSFFARIETIRRVNQPLFPSEP